MNFYEHQTLGMTVLDGRRRVAVAKHYRGSGWLVKGYGLCWTNPGARKPNKFGYVLPDYILLPTRQKARSLLKAIATT